MTSPKPSTPADVCRLSAAELAAGFANHTLDPRVVTEQCLERIEATRPLCAFAYVDAEGARAAAAASAARWAAGAPMSRLDGVPVTQKDLQHVQGWPTRRGSAATDDAPQPVDSPSSARLREAGCVMLGKTTTPDHGWKAVGDSPVTGIARNPWNPAHTPGGSSAGAAIAAAVGAGALHVGTDGGGSIRIPAAFSGIVGFKPTWGRAAMWPPSPFAIVSHLGPMTRTVADAALMMSVLAGLDARDANQIPLRLMDEAHLDQGLSGLSIALSLTLGQMPVDREIAAAVTAAAELAAAAGAVVEAVDPPLPPDIQRAWLTFWNGGAARLADTLPADRLALLDPGLGASIEAGRRLSARDWLAAEAVRMASVAAMSAFHTRHQLLITPAVGVPALPAGALLARPTDQHWTDWAGFAWPFNLTRQPAVVIPCGLTAAGLPIGVQVLGPMYADAEVLGAAAALERLIGFAARHPLPLGIGC
ncbi:MAG: amidase [Alphaproteobacteria bacterium]|nr:MAG: amidase [Alphaproteobacteria bacterium]